MYTVNHNSNNQKAWEFVAVFPDEKGTYGKRIAESKWQSNYNLTNSRVPSPPIAAPVSPQQQHQQHQQPRPNVHNQPSPNQFTSQIRIAPPNPGAKPRPPPRLTQPSSPNGYMSHGNRPGQQSPLASTPTYQPNLSNVPVTKSPVRISQPTTPPAQQQQSWIYEQYNQDQTQKQRIKPENGPQIINTNAKRKQRKRPTSSPNINNSRLVDKFINGQAASPQPPRRKAELIMSSDPSFKPQRHSFSQFPTTPTGNSGSEGSSDESMMNYEFSPQPNPWNFDNSLASSVAGSIPSTASAFCPLTSSSPALHEMILEEDKNRRWSSFI